MEHALCARDCQSTAGRPKAQVVTLAPPGAGDESTSLGTGAVLQKTRTKCQAEWHAYVWGESEKAPFAEDGVELARWVRGLCDLLRHPSSCPLRPQ